MQDSVAFYAAPGESIRVRTPRQRLEAMRRRYFWLGWSACAAVIAGLLAIAELVR